MKKVVILDEEEMEVLNKNLAIAYGISNKLDVSGENKRKADHISELIKAAIDVINGTVQVEIIMVEKWKAQEIVQYLEEQLSNSLLHDDLFESMEDGYRCAINDIKERYIEDD